MSKLGREVWDLAQELMEYSDTITTGEAFSVAVKIQHNRVLEDAFMLNRGADTPSALESIAMELGAADDNYTIKDALYNLKKNK